MYIKNPMKLIYMVVGWNWVFVTRYISWCKYPPTWESTLAKPSKSSELTLYTKYGTEITIQGSFVNTCNTTLIWIEGWYIFVVIINVSFETKVETQPNCRLSRQTTWLPLLYLLKRFSESELKGGIIYWVGV